MKRFLEEKRESVLISVGEERIGGVYIRKRERREVVKRDVDPYIIRVGIKRRKKGGGKFRKG